MMALVGTWPTLPVHTLPRYPPKLPTTGVTALAPLPLSPAPVSTVAQSHTVPAGAAGLGVGGEDVMFDHGDCCDSSAPEGSRFPFRILLHRFIIAATAESCSPRFDLCVADVPVRVTGPK